MKKTQNQKMRGASDELTLKEIDDKLIKIWAE